MYIMRGCGEQYIMRRCGGQQIMIAYNGQYAGNKEGIYGGQ